MFGIPLIRGLGTRTVWGPLVLAVVVLSNPTGELKTFMAAYLVLAEKF